MRILQRHIAGQFLATTGLAAAVLLFILLSGNLMRAFELLARGVPSGTILAFVAYLLPRLLTYTIPLAVLCGAVVMFSRLSADNEITAMRASGTSLWQILSPCLWITLVLSAACLILHTWVSPICHERADRLKHGAALTNAAAFLEPGRQVQLPGHVLYVEEIDGDRLRHVQVYTLDDQGELREDIHARKGRLFEGEEGALTLLLQNAVIAQRGKAASGGGGERIQTPELKLQINVDALTGQARLFRDPDYLRLPDLFSAIDVLRERGRDVTSLYVELHTRLSLSMAPVAFLLIGIPFGIRTQRSETSIGMVVSLVLALVFYAFIVVADNLKSNPAAHPDLIVWIPAVLYQVGGLLGLHYIASR